MSKQKKLYSKKCKFGIIVCVRLYLLLKFIKYILFISPTVIFPKYCARVQLQGMRPWKRRLFVLNLRTSFTLHCSSIQIFKIRFVVNKWVMNL